MNVQDFTSISRTILVLKWIPWKITVGARDQLNAAELLVSMGLPEMYAVLATRELTKWLLGRL